MESRAGRGLSQILWRLLPELAALDPTAAAYIRMYSDNVSVGDLDEPADRSDDRAVTRGAIYPVGARR